MACIVGGMLGGGDDEVEDGGEIQGVRGEVTLRLLDLDGGNGGLAALMKALRMALTFWP